MTRFLLDSNFCIACLRRKPWALQVLGRVPLASVAVSSITVGELLLGTHLAEDANRERAKVEAFLRPIQVLPFGREEAVHWAKLDATLRRQGSRIETEDAIIAATALASGMTLVTGNAAHFGRVKGLRIVDWELKPPAAFLPQ
jgi:tRNA(fMet)-specific endonuclease VapC